MTERVFTTQQTGKGPKLMQLSGIVLICLSVFGCVFAEGNPTGVGVSVGASLLGVILWFAGRFIGWWRHG